MTCKDCIHYDVCDGYRIFDVGIENKECYGFKDKSKFIELPCNVDDTVFDIRYGYVDEKSVEMINIYDNRAEADCGYGRYFDLSCIGKSVFLTREEAEKALNECDDE